MSTIRFETAPLKIRDWTFLMLPKSASAKLPSRGMTLVEGTINGFRSKIVLEPDGKGSHWFRVDAGLRELAGIEAGDTVKMAVEPSKEWPEPEVPVDLHKALASDPQANALWVKITPWHVGTGSAGYAPLITMKRAAGASREHYRSSRTENEGHVASIVIFAPNPRSRKMECSSSQSKQRSKDLQ
ncbi:MAG: DUF1905 domain-containing protein [Anaerolineales bacterium]